MPALPGAHLILIHAHLALASFEARFNAGASLNDSCQFHQRRLFQLHLGHTRRAEVVMGTVAGILISGSARGAGLYGPLIWERSPGDHQPLWGPRTFALDPCLHPAPDQLDLPRSFLAVSYRQMRPCVARE